MDANTQNIKKVFQNDILMQIPYYQRRYVWNEETDHNWSRFADDMESTVNIEGNYFLGALITKEERCSTTDRANGITRKCVVVDGQQRLTTLAIYMKVLHMKTARETDFSAYFLHDNGIKDPVLVHNCDDRPAFEKIMCLETLQDLHDDSQITRAYRYFCDRFDKYRNNGGNLDDLRTSIYATVKFVTIELSADDDEQQIFDTINSLGVDLTTDELLKNYLYSINDRENYLAWRDMFDLDEKRKFWGTDAASKRQESTRGNRVIDRFLYAFVRIKMWDFRDRLTPDHKIEFVKTSNVYKTCKTFVDDFKMDRLELASEIIDYARIFMDMFASNDLIENRISADWGVSRIAFYIKALESYAILPYLLFIKKNVLDARELNSICQILETYLIRRKLAHADDKMYSEFFTERLIGSANCRTADELRSYCSDRASTLSCPHNDDVIQNATAYKMDERTAAVIYYMYETIKDNRSIEGFSAYMAEQLMPTPAKANQTTWVALPNPDAELERKTLSKTIGNYFLLKEPDDRLVKRVHNDNFGTKKQALQPYTSSSAQVLNNLITWNSNAIIERTKKFVDHFNSTVWSELQPSN